MDVADHTLELLKRFHAEFTDYRREQESLRVWIFSLEQHFATVSGDIAQIRSELYDIRADVAQIRRRLNLVEA